MKLAVTLGALMWVLAILAFGDLVIWVAGVVLVLLIVIAVEASVEEWLRRRHPSFEAQGRKRVGLR